MLAILLFCLLLIFGFILLVHKSALDKCVRRPSVPYLEKRTHKILAAIVTCVVVDPLVSQPILSSHPSLPSDFFFKNNCWNVYDFKETKCLAGNVEPGRHIFALFRNEDVYEIYLDGVYRASIPYKLFHAVYVGKSKPENIGKFELYLEDECSVKGLSAAQKRQLSKKF